MDDCCFLIQQVNGDGVGWISEKATSLVLELEFGRLCRVYVSLVDVLWLSCDESDGALAFGDFLDEGLEGLGTRRLACSGDDDFDVLHFWLLLFVLGDAYLWQERVWCE